MILYVFTTIANMIGEWRLYLSLTYNVAAAIFLAICLTNGFFNELFINM